MTGESPFLDSVFDNVILPVINFILGIIFSNSLVTLLFWYILINIIAIVLIKKDKKYAQNDKWRIKESTLLFVALAGGAVGMYYAMFKYKHKTLHKKFTILVPTFILLHFAFISYMIVNSFVV